MSASMVKAHGGSRMLQSVEGGGSLMKSGIVHDTMINSPKDAKMRELSRVISNTTGIPREKPIMEGVIQDTLPSGMRSVPEYKKVPAHDVGKTKTKRMGQVAYAGPKY